MATPKHVIRKSKQISKSDLTGKILNYFKENPTKVVNYKQILSALNLQKANLRDVAITILDSLEHAGKIQEVQYGKYKANMRMGHVTGIIDRQSVAKKNLSYSGRWRREYSHCREIYGLCIEWRPCRGTTLSTSTG